MGGLNSILEFNDGMGRLVVNCPDGNLVAFGVGVVGADEYSCD